MSEATRMRSVGSSQLGGANDDVLDRLDKLFAVRTAPFCGTGY